MSTKTKRNFIIVLRLLALGATISAFIVMVTNHESTQVLNITFTVKYTNEPVFKYYVVAEAMASVYSIVVVFLSSKGLYSRLIIIMDVVITLLLTSSISAAVAVAHVGKKGNSHAGWLPICGQVPKFCDHVTGSLVAGFIAAVIYLVIVLHALYGILSPVLA